MKLSVTHRAVGHCKVDQEFLAGGGWRCAVLILLLLAVMGVGQANSIGYESPGETVFPQSVWAPVTSSNCGLGLFSFFQGCGGGPGPDHSFDYFWHHHHGYHPPDGDPTPNPNSTVPEANSALFVGIGLLLAVVVKPVLRLVQ